MLIKAKSGPDTAEVFHYPVPLHGVSKPQQIFILLSLRSASPVQSNFSHFKSVNIYLSIGPRDILDKDNMTFDVERASRIMQDILRERHDSLGDLLHDDLLQRVTQRMYAANLVSGAVNNLPNFNNLMKEYGVMLRECRDQSNFITYCQTFIRILSDQGGPLKMISEVIADAWEKEIKKQLNISLNFTC